MVVVKHIGVLSIAKVYACVSAVGGFLEGLLISIIRLTSVSSYMQIPGLLGFLFSPAAVVLFPIIFAIIGFIGGAIGAFLYNIVASSIGGVEIDFEGGETPTGPTKIESPY